VAGILPSGTGTPTAPSSDLVSCLFCAMASAMAPVRSVSEAQMRRCAPRSRAAPGYRRSCGARECPGGRRPPRSSSYWDPIAHSGRAGAEPRSRSPARRGDRRAARTTAPRHAQRGPAHLLFPKLHYQSVFVRSDVAWASACSTADPIHACSRAASSAQSRAMPSGDPFTRAEGSHAEPSASLSGDVRRRAAVGNLPGSIRTRAASTWRQTSDWVL